MKSVKTCLMMSFVILLSGCDPGGLMNSTSRPDHTNVESVLTNARYKLSYDQKTWSFSTQWPSSMVGTLGKEGSTDQLLLDSYENVREIVAFDDKGLMTSTRSWLEGNADQTLPDDLYNKVKDIMPTHGDGHDPVVRSVLSGNTMRYYSRSGKLVSETQVDARAFQIDPTLLDSLANMQQNTNNVQSRVARYLASLQSSGMNLRTINDRYVEFTQNAQNDPEVVKVRNVLDVKTGDIVRSADLRMDGKVLSETLFRFVAVKGQSVMQHSRTTHYGERNGQWVMTHRTVTDRQNIDISIK